MQLTTIQHILEESGLTDKESRTYTALLGLGSTTPYQVAKKSGLKAPITYVILDSLLQKGLVLKTPHKSGWRFQAKRIDEFVSSKQQATQNLSSIVQTINSLISASPRANILYFNGTEEIRAALHYNIEHTKQFSAFYGSAKNTSEALQEIFLAWYAELKTRNITQRIIAPKDPSLLPFRLLDAEYGNITKEAASDLYNSESSIEIHDTFIRIVMLNTSTAIIIEDDNLPQVFKNVFELVWGVL